MCAFLGFTSSTDVFYHFPRSCQQAKHTFGFKDCSSAQLYLLSWGPALLGQTCRNSFASGFPEYVPDEQDFAIYNQRLFVVIQLVLALCETTASFCKTHSCPVS